MAPITVIDTIVPKNNGNFAVVEDINIKGGWRVAADLTERNAIPSGRRKAGMQCYVIAESKTYALIGGVDNLNWTELPTSSRYAKTTGAFTVRCNPSTGVIPPTSLVVTNQAEYDALGYKIAHPQYALDMLPSFIGHKVIIILEAGTYGAIANRAGTGYNSVLFWPYFKGANGAALDVVGGLTVPGVYIVGETKTTIEASQAGTVSLGTKITRSAGTWTVNQHKGRLVLIDSGVGSGKIRPVVSNTTTELILADSNLGAGACTFLIYEPAAILQNGAADTYSIVQLSPGPDRGIHYDGIMFGTAGTPFSAFSAYDAEIMNSILIMKTALTFIPTVADITQAIRSCSIRSTVGSNYGLSVSGASSAAAYMYNSFMYDGAFTSLPKLLVSDKGTLYLYGSVIEMGAGSTSGANVATVTGALAVRQLSILDGKSLSGGLYIEGPYGKITPLNNSLNINNTITAAVLIRNAGIVDIPQITGSGNAVGFNVQAGSRVSVVSPASLAATTEITIDGDNITYAEALPTQGDQVVGKYSSSILRR